MRDDNSHTNSRLSTLMQLLFSFDQKKRAEKTLIQAHASQRLLLVANSRLLRPRGYKKLYATTNRRVGCKIRDLCTYQHVSWSVLAPLLCKLITTHACLTVTHLRSPTCVIVRLSPQEDNMRLASRYIQRPNIIDHV